MPWIQLKLEAISKNIEEIAEFLMENGALSATFSDNKDVPVYEPMPGEVPLWVQTDITGLYDAGTNMTSILERLKASPLFDNSSPYKIEILEDKDWEREWMVHFKPMKFGTRLWICPSWKPVVDKDAVNVLLDPGLAFGTGTHPTTALCLEWLDAQSLNDKTAIDFGCGSGILAIAALKLGAQKVQGIDIDPQAILASQDNAQRNNVSERLELYLPDDVPSNAKADLLIANILAGPLRALATQIETLVKARGKIALSGILAEQAAELTEIYSQWFDMDEVVIREGWARLSGIKKLNK